MVAAINSQHAIAAVSPPLLGDEACYFGGILETAMNVVTMKEHYLGTYAVCQIYARLLAPFQRYKLFIF